MLSFSLQQRGCWEDQRLAAWRSVQLRSDVALHLMTAWVSEALLLCLGLREPAASRGAAPLQSLCMAAILLHSCNHHARLQSLWMAEITLHSCYPCAQLQSSCISAITVHGCRPCAWLQSLRMAAILMRSLQSLGTSAITVDGCNHHAWLQSLRMAAIALHGFHTYARLQSSCTAVLGWPRAGARGEITGAWPSA